jgi:hypothetical protein
MTGRKVQQDIIAKERKDVETNIERKKKKLSKNRLVPAKGGVPLLEVPANERLKEIQLLDAKASEM